MHGTNYINYEIIMLTTIDKTLDTKITIVCNKLIENQFKTLFSIKIFIFTL